MSVQDSNQFMPNRLVVLSELSTREKEKYYNILLSNKVKFHRDESGRYVASLRLLAPGVKKENETKKIVGNGPQSLPLEERLSRLNQQFVTVKIVGVEPFDYSPYNRFTLLIGTNGEIVRPKMQSLSWLMKRIESLYDARFVHEKMDVERDDSTFTSEYMVSIFPMFVVKWFSTEKGLIKTIVDQNCWDLLCNVHAYRKDFLEVEIFARFLQEFYDNDDLLFYLYVRSVVGKVLHVAFKTQWAKSDGPARQPKGLWMSYKECVHVARIVFGADNDSMWKRFLGIIGPQMVGQKTANSDTRRIDITQFLHLAVVGYHQAAQQPPPGSSSSSRAGGTMDSNQQVRRGEYTDANQEIEMEQVDDAPFVQDSGFLNQHNPDNGAFEEEQRFAAEYRQLHQLQQQSYQNQNNSKEVSGRNWVPGLDFDVNNLSGADEYSSSLDAYLAALSEDKIGGLPGALTNEMPRRRQSGENVQESLLNIAQSSLHDHEPQRIPDSMKGYYHHDQHYAIGSTPRDTGAGYAQPSSARPVATDQPKLIAHLNAQYSGGFESDGSNSTTNTPTRSRRQAPRLPVPQVPVVDQTEPQINDAGKKSWLNEVGQWQEEEPSHPHPPGSLQSTTSINKANYDEFMHAVHSAEAAVETIPVINNVSPMTSVSPSRSHSMASVQSNKEVAAAFTKSDAPSRSLSVASVQSNKEVAVKSEPPSRSLSVASTHSNKEASPLSTKPPVKETTPPVEYSRGESPVTQLPVVAVEEVEHVPVPPPEPVNSRRNSLKERLQARMKARGGDGGSGADSRSETPIPDHSESNQIHPDVSAQAIADALGRVADVDLNISAEEVPTSPQEAAPSYEDVSNSFNDANAENYVTEDNNYGEENYVGENNNDEYNSSPVGDVPESYGNEWEANQEYENYQGEDDRGEGTEVDQEQPQQDEEYGAGEEAVGEEPDEYASLQLDREREFLSYLCEPLGELPENIAEEMVGELADQLRAKINAELAGREVSDIEMFDGLLVDILQSESLRVDMESLRDSMLKYLFEQVEQQQQGNDGEEEYGADGEYNNDGDE